MLYKKGILCFFRKPLHFTNIEDLRLIILSQMSLLFMNFITRQEMAIIEWAIEIFVAN